MEFVGRMFSSREGKGREGSIDVASILVFKKFFFLDGRIEGNFILGKTLTKLH